MTCTCGTSGVYNEVRGQGFYYCRSCKVEIELREPYREPMSGVTMSQEEIDELFQYIPTDIDYLTGIA